MAIEDGFRNRIGSVALVLTKFVDRNGIWSKAPETCVSVTYQFADNFSGEMSFADYKTLTEAQKELILEAPSSLAV